MFHRSAVLCALATTFSISIAIAQPPEPPVVVAEPSQPAEDLPLLPMKLDEFLARNGGLTRLKLKMDGATAEEIAAEMKKQTGLDIVPAANLIGMEDKVPRSSVEATGQPFWQAVSQWNRGGDTPLYLQRGMDSFRLLPWGGRRGRALMVGPFYFELNYISRSTTRSLSLDLNPDAITKPSLSDSLSLQNSLQTDPKFSPLIAAFSTKIESATDDRGRVVALDRNDTSPQPPNDNWPGHISLKAPEADAKSVNLKGVIRIAAITKSERWEIDLRATPEIEKTFKSETVELTYRLDGLNTEATRSTANLHITRKNIGPQRIFKDWPNGSWVMLGDFSTTTRSIRFFNAAGELMSSDTRDSAPMAIGDAPTFDIGFNINRNPNKDAARNTPAKMIIDVPLEWREVRVPFEFKDLPLP